MKLDGITLWYLLYSHSPKGTVSVMHVYQTQYQSVTGPSSVQLCTAEYAQMDNLCTSQWLFQNGAVRETNPDFMTPSVFAADALTGVSVILYSLPMGNLECRVCRIETLLWSSAPDASSCDEWGPGPQTSVATRMRDVALDLLLGFWYWSKNN